jgi:hypothetical protein
MHLADAVKDQAFSFNSGEVHTSEPDTRALAAVIRVHDLIRR